MEKEQVKQALIGKTIRNDLICRIPDMRTNETFFGIVESVKYNTRTDYYTICFNDHINFIELVSWEAEALVQGKKINTCCIKGIEAYKQIVY